MPEVRVSYKHPQVSLEILECLHDTLPDRVAEALARPEAHLTSRAIEVHAVQVGFFDVQEVDLSLAVMVESNDYPPSRDQLGEAQVYIVRWIRQKLQERKSLLSFSVRVRCLPGTFYTTLP